MDRTYFLTQQVERLDDQAFAAAEDAGAGAGGMSVACIARNAGHERIAGMPSRMVCEPQAVAWLAQMMPLE